MQQYHLHLVSDSTGETVNTIARACVVQFEGVHVVEHLWSMIRTSGQLKQIFKEIESEPGMVLFTLLDHEMQHMLERFCRRLNVPCIGVLDPFIAHFAAYLGVESRGLPGRQHAMNAEYFTRIEAMNFAMSHDDGQHTVDLEEADVILVGVSRTSKTPTCIYLANRGIKAANVPIVPSAPLPPPLVDDQTRALIIGLTEDPDRLVQIRRNRIRLIQGDGETDYTNLERVREEVLAARRLFRQKGWPVIDVTRRSIEETAAEVMSLLAHGRREGDEPDESAAAKTDGR